MRVRRIRSRSSRSRSLFRFRSLSAAFLLCSASRADGPTFLAAAGLNRLGKAEHIDALLDPAEMLPAAGQGAIAVQCRADDMVLLALLSMVNDPAAAAEVRAERAVLAELVRRCTAAGFRQMVAVIGHPGNPASLALHQGLGFTHAGEFKAIGYKFGRWIDAIMLQRSLGEGSSTAPED